VASLTDTPGPRLEERKPPSTGPINIAFFRESQVVNPSGVKEPTVVALDLAEWTPSVPELVELVVPLAQGARSGHLGPLALVLCTSDQPTRDVLRALAETYDLAMFLAPAVNRLGEAEPLGVLTPTERQTLDVMQRLGGVVSVAKFAEATRLAAPAATNRLVSVAQKGFVQKVERPRQAGAVFLDPRAAIPANQPHFPELQARRRRELEIFAAVAGRSPEDMMASAQTEYLEEHGSAPPADEHGLAAVWADYRQRHAGELSEGLRWAQAMLADAGRASVEMSGMSDQDLDELRRAFE
jgi:hypothetical protein